MIPREQHAAEMRAMFQRAAAAAKQKGTLAHYVVTKTLALEAIFDPRIGDGALDYMMRAFAGATGRTPGAAASKLECFGCLRPWTRERGVISIVSIEFIDLADDGKVNGLLAGLCEDCLSTEALKQACQRDFGSDAPFRIVMPPGTA